jgi:hypothetical protein
MKFFFTMNGIHKHPKMDSTIPYVAAYEVRLEKE